MRKAVRLFAKTCQDVKVSKLGDTYAQEIGVAVRTAARAWCYQHVRQCHPYHPRAYNHNCQRVAHSVSLANNNNWVQSFFLCLPVSCCRLERVKRVRKIYRNTTEQRHLDQKKEKVFVNNNAPFDISTFSYVMEPHKQVGDLRIHIFFNSTI